MTSLSDWTPADRVLASAEGWDLFECDGSENGPVQIQSFDSPEEGEPSLAGGDTEAWKLVWRGAAAGVAHHQKALAILRADNPMEADAIERSCQAAGEGS